MPHHCPHHRHLRCVSCDICKRGLHTATSNAAVVLTEPALRIVCGDCAAEKDAK